MSGEVPRGAHGAPPTSYPNGLGGGGGSRLLQLAMAADLVDAMYRSVLPCLLGREKRLFRVRPDLDHDADFIAVSAPGRHPLHLLEARAPLSGSVLLHCARSRPDRAWPPRRM